MPITRKLKEILPYKLPLYRRTSLEDSFGVGIVHHGPIVKEIRSFLCFASFARNTITKAPLENPKGPKVLLFLDLLVCKVLGPRDARFSQEN